MAAVRRRMKETYPGIRRRLKRRRVKSNGVMNRFFCSDHQDGTSYGKRGKTPVISGTGQRFGCNMVSTFTNQGKLTFMVIQERFTRTLFWGSLANQNHGSRLKIYRFLVGRKSQFQVSRCTVIAEIKPHGMYVVRSWHSFEAEESMSRMTKQSSSVTSTSWPLAVRVKVNS